MIERGIDLQMRDKSGRTALHAMVINSNSRHLCRAWVGCILDFIPLSILNCRDNSGKTALDYAVEFEREPEFIELLRKKMKAAILD